MKKLIFIAPVLLAFGLVLPVFAANNNQAGAQQVQQQIKTSPSPSGNQIQNQNQIETKNQGEDSQIQENTQEQENLGEEQGDGSQNRNQNAVENMSTVALKVQELLQLRTTGGIGEEVRQVAREQNQAQTQIQAQLDKINSKGQLARFLTGTDYGAVKNLEAQLEQNQLRIKQLEQLQNKLVNQGDITMVKETIQALIEENTSLQEIITTEGQLKSLFGWLFKLFAQ
jgi:hypothetical protein